jgi:hypothetical protein
MAVVTIDAKAELAEIQAQIDADGLELGTTGETKAPQTEAAETKSAEAAADPKDDEDEEGDDGLTSRERHDLLAVGRKDLPESVKRVIGKRVAQRKAAEEFAAAQYSERKLAESRAAAAERELADLKAKAQPFQEAVKPDAEAGKPQRDKFPAGAEGDSAYWDAVIDWRADRRAEAKFEERRKQEETAAAERRRTEVIEAATARIAAARAAVPDYDQVRASIPDDVIVPPVVAGYMEKSEMIAELAYHLAKHPEVLAKITKLPPDEQLVTIGKIESTLTPFVAGASSAAAKATDGATPSKAATSTNGQRSQTAPSEDTGTIPSRARDTAPVIRPLNGSGASPAEVAPQDLDIRGTIHAWEKRNNADFSRRKRH